MYRLEYLIPGGVAVVDIDSGIDTAWEASLATTWVFRTSKMRARNRKKPGMIVNTRTRLYKVVEGSKSSSEIG